jgi:phosphate uptake regulator
MERKVIKMGDSSLVISLPKVWIEKAKVTKGNIVEVGELATGELIVKPKTTEARKKEVDITDQRRLDRCIIDHYINGADTIRISSEEALNPEDMEVIYDTVNNLSGLEITEASGKKVVIEYLGGGTMPFKKLLSRFSLIVTNHLKSLKTAFEENSAVEIESIRKIQETDKLYYTLLRNLITASSDVKASSEMQLKSKDPVYYTLLVKNLWEMAKLAEKVDFHDTRFNKKISYFFDKALECHRRSMEAWRKRDRDMALDTAEAVESLLMELRMARKEVANLEEAPAKEELPQARMAKLKEIIVGPEQQTIENLLNTLGTFFYYINKNLNIATLSSIE